MCLHNISLHEEHNAVFSGFDLNNLSCCLLHIFLFVTLSCAHPFLTDETALHSFLFFYK